MVCLTHSRVKNLSVASEEQILLDKLAQGDRDAFWPLWESYRDYLYHRCRAWMGGNHDEAKEVMSLASLKAWDKLPNHAQSITNLKGWLNRFTHNLCIDIHRQRTRHAVGVENIDDITLYKDEIRTSSSNHPELALLQQELKIYLRYCIDALPSRLHYPLILRYYQEMSYADIGRELSISQDNVVKRLQQARKILKKHLCRYFSGLNTVAIDEAQLQKLEEKDFQLPINTDSTVEEINYRITISCLETLPPVWYKFHPAQDCS